MDGENKQLIMPADAPADAPIEVAPVVRSRPPRDTGIDVMKGLGMILVIITHMVAKDQLGYSFIAYVLTFLMPMYFFITGYLHAGSSDVKLGFGRYLLKKLRTLALPYLIFCGVYMLWMQTVDAYANGGQLFGFPVNWADVADGVVLAGRYLFDNTLLPSPMWFLHGMFFASLIFYFIMKIKNRAVLLIVALALAAVTVPLESALHESPIWLLKLLPAALFYLIMGHLFRSVVTEGFRERLKKGVFFSIMVPLASMVIGLFIMQEARGDMWEITNPLYFVGSLASIFGCYCLGQNVQSRPLQYVGANSLMYLGLHPLILNLPQAAGLPEWFLGRGFDGVAVFLGYFAVSFVPITLLVMIGVGVQKGFKMLFNRREAEKPEVPAAG